MRISISVLNRESFVERDMTFMYYNFNKVSIFFITCLVSYFKQMFFLVASFDMVYTIFFIAKLLYDSNCNLLVKSRGKRDILSSYLRYTAYFICEYFI